MSLSGPDVARAAQSAVQRVEWGDGTPPTFEGALALTGQVTGGLTKADLAGIVAYLACQVAGRDRDRDADASLAVAQVARIVHEYEDRRGRTA